MVMNFLYSVSILSLVVACGWTQQEAKEKEKSSGSALLTDKIAAEGEINNGEFALTVSQDTLKKIMAAAHKYLKEDAPEKKDVAAPKHSLWATIAIYDGKAPMPEYRECAYTKHGKADDDYGKMNEEKSEGFELSKARHPAIKKKFKLPKSSMKFQLKEGRKTAVMYVYGWKGRKIFWGTAEFNIVAGEVVKTSIELKRVGRCKPKKGAVVVDVELPADHQARRTDTKVCRLAKAFMKESPVPESCSDNRYRCRFRVGDMAFSKTMSCHRYRAMHAVIDDICKLFPIVEVKKKHFLEKLKASCSEHVPAEQEETVEPELPVEPAKPEQPDPSDMPDWSKMEQKDACEELKASEGCLMYMEKDAACVTKFKSESSSGVQLTKGFNSCDAKRRILKHLCEADVKFYEIDCKSN